MAFLAEADIEQALLTQLRRLGYSIASDDVIGPDGNAPERESHDVVVLHKRLETAVLRLNPALPPEARADAIRKLTQSEFPALLEENPPIHTLLTEGVDVEYYGDDGVLTAGKVRLLDFDTPENNDWLAVQQFVVINGQVNRRPDVVRFANGLRLAVIELKAPGSAARIWRARSTSCRLTSSRFRRCFTPMRCWSLRTALPRAWGRCPPIWNASCRGAPRMAARLRPRVRRSWQR